MVIIGLTGRTGGGASSAAKILARRGARVIDADAIAHRVLLPDGGAYEDVVAAFGPRVLDKNKFIDRKKVAGIVFSDPASLAALTSATHARILAEIINQIEDAKHSGAALVCIDAPLLVESGLYESCDYVWAVFADDDIRLKRIIARDKITEAEAVKRIGAQAPFAEIAKRADAVIMNNGSVGGLTEEIIKKMDECLRD